MADSTTTNLADLGWKHCPSCKAFLPALHPVTTWCTGHYDTPAWQANERLNAKLEIAIKVLEQIRDMEAFEFDQREAAKEALQQL